MNFKANDLIVILVAGGIDYISEIAAASSPFTLHPGSTGISPVVENWVATSATSCTVDTSTYIEDSVSTRYAKIIGPRPANIVRR